MLFLKNLYYRTHRFFRRSNFHLFSLLFLALIVSSLTTSLWSYNAGTRISEPLTSETQDGSLATRQSPQADNSAETNIITEQQIYSADVVCDPNNVCVEKCGNTTCTTNQTCIRDNFNDVIAVCATQRSVDDGGDCGTTSGKPNSLVCKSGRCGSDLKCTGATDGEITCSMPGDDSSCVIKCGTTSCSYTTQKCEKSICVPKTTSGDTTDESSGGSPSDSSGDNGGTTSSLPGGGQWPCNGGYCDEVIGTYCFEQNGVTGCCKEPNCGASSTSSGGTGGTSGDGSTGGAGGTLTCNSNTQVACSGACYNKADCPTGNGKCESSKFVCDNNGCATGMKYAGSGMCCPDHGGLQPKLCPTDSKKCCYEGIQSNPQPNTFSLSKPVPDCDKVALSWGTTNADSFTIETHLGNNTLFKSDSVPAGTYKYTVKGLQKDTIYMFGITAHSSTLGTRRTQVQTVATLPTCLGTTGTTTATTATTPLASSTSTGSTSTPTTPKTGTTTGGTTGSTPGGTTTGRSLAVSLDLTLPGIGGGNGKNSNPGRRTRKVSIAAISSTGTTFNGSGNLTFDANSNSYKGTVTITGLPAGTYTVKIRFDNSLWKKVPNTATITSGNKSLSISNVELVTGDLDQDNSMTASDYTLFVACYKGLSSCSSSKKTIADLDDNEKIDLLDLNILQRGFTVQDGD